MSIAAKPGQWALSRILVEDDGGYNTAAGVQQLAPQVENYYPPLVAGSYVLPVALVRLIGPVGAPDADTWLLPALATTLRQLSGAQRNSLRTLLDGKLAGYQFTDWDGATVVKAAFRSADLSLDSALGDIVPLVFEHLAHSEYRAKPAAVETHNTEYTDDFGTDPSSRWTVELGAWAWDSGTFDMDANLASFQGARYTNGSPGSIEHEAQCTAVLGASRGPGPGVRFDNTGVDDWYSHHWGGANVYALSRWNAGTRSALTTFPLTGAENDFCTYRLAASGTAGSNVVLDTWATNHGTSKPSDPGWYGDSGSPGGTYTDTNASRLDDSVHAQCGVGCRNGGTDFDTQIDFFKLRAISDRAGAGTIPHHVFGKMLVGPFGGPI